MPQTGKLPSRDLAGRNGQFTPRANGSPAKSAAVGRNGTANASPNISSVGNAIGHYRWVICGLLFFCDDHKLCRPAGARTSERDIQKDLRWSEIDYRQRSLCFYDRLCNRFAAGR